MLPTLAAGRVAVRDEYLECFIPCTLRFHTLLHMSFRDLLTLGVGDALLYMLQTRTVVRIRDGHALGGTTPLRGTGEKILHRFSGAAVLAVGTNVDKAGRTHEHAPLYMAFRR